MGYIRDRREELTGYQERAELTPEIDLQCDFVMVYGIDETMTARVRAYKEAGYRVHLMTGIAWGDYQDYLDGKWDGRSHWDESQTDRNGNPILHGTDTPYMVPSIAFSDYLTERLKAAVDAGVEALHLEEPEFWDHGGYSEAFKREYRLYYREAWQPPHTSPDAHYKASKLKTYLYARALGRIGSALKEYALVQYGRELRVYVPTHSLINYAQWKILSPESALIDLPCVDGYIAQVWTGTSRVPNVYEGVKKERTFETAFLEYGVMQELVRGTGRKMWFLHDPIEDWPEYTWEDYRKNYLKTVVASFLHPAIHSYEICPWPDRVFHGVYPRRAGMARGTIPTTDLDGAKPIPASYATLLSGIIQLSGDLDQEDVSFDGADFEIGVLIADSALYQRSCPDHVSEDGPEQEWNTGPAFPHFYGMTLPLLKHGLAVRPVQLDNVRRFPDFLAGYTVLILSYEYIKPGTPDVNNALAAWVKGGGTLLYLGDGTDPYHSVKGWWNTKTADYADPARHLFEMLDLPRTASDGTYPAGKGQIVIHAIPPARLCLDRQAADEYRALVARVLKDAGCSWTPSNHLTLRRGPYVISAVMDESIDAAPKVFRGVFADLLENHYPIITEKRVLPDGNAILFDFAKIEDEPVRIVGTSARVFSLECTTAGFSMTLKAANRIRVFTRVRLPHRVTALKLTDEQNQPVLADWEWNRTTRTLLLSYLSRGQSIAVDGTWESG